MSWHGLIEDYGVAERAGGRSPGTVRLHRHYLANLARRYPAGPPTDTGALRAVLAAPQWSAETRKSARSAYRGFYRWAYAEGRVPANPAEALEPVRVPAGVARPAPEQVVRAALSAAGPRERLMIALAAYAGLRCCEIAAVHRSDLAGDVLRVTGKGGRVREVPILDADLLAALRAVRAWAFPSPAAGRGHLTAGHVSRLVGRALPPGWTAHTLRHRMATRAYAGTGDLLAVQTLLGHAKPETTRRYVRVPDDALRRAVSAAA